MSPAESLTLSHSILNNLFFCDNLSENLKKGVEKISGLQ